MLKPIGTIAGLGLAVASVSWLYRALRRRFVSRHRGNLGINVETSITIKESPERLYRFWRNFENLLDLRPGVSKYPGNSGWTNSTNGGRPHDNYFMVDGINSNDPWMAQSMMNAVMAAGDAGTILAIDAIDEFKTQQNPGADYGWKPGAVVNVGVKSGSNTMHGSAYFYGRRGSWDARNFLS